MKSVTDYAFEYNSIRQSMHTRLNSIEFAKDEIVKSAHRVLLKEEVDKLKEIWVNMQLLHIAELSKVENKY